MRSKGKDAKAGYHKISNNGKGRIWNELQGELMTSNDRDRSGETTRADGRIRSGVGFRNQSGFRYDDGFRNSRGFRNDEERGIERSSTNFYQRTRNQNGHVEWKEGLVVKGLAMGKNNDLFILVTVYNNCGWGNLMNDLDEIIIEAEERGEGIMIVGDMNARIGEEQGRADDGEGVEKERVSRDKVKNPEGRKLTDFCEKNGLLILNGKCEGDREGNFTSTGEDGGSVIDYIIITDEKETIIKKMEIKVRVESDHLPIAITIKNEIGNGNRRKKRKETEGQE